MNFNTAAIRRFLARRPEALVV